MSLTDLFRAARGAYQGSQHVQGAETAQMQGPAAGGATAEPPPDDLPGGIARSIDVSHLPPPLPMVRILETLRDLGPSETLLVRHTRRPIHLYPKLDALGCTHETTVLGSGKIQVRITNPSTRSS
jgi:hypothetical protein